MQVLPKIPPLQGISTRAHNDSVSIPQKQSNICTAQDIIQLQVWVVFPTPTTLQKDLYIISDIYFILLFFACVIILFFK